MRQTVARRSGFAATLRRRWWIFPIILLLVAAGLVLRALAGLVDATLEKHPELLILALHVKPPSTSDFVIIASNIGRIGKKADDDDLGVIRTEKPLLEVNEAGNRFEVEIVLLLVVLATAVAAWYASFATVTNKTFGRIVMPVKELKK